MSAARHGALALALLLLLLPWPPAGARQVAGVDLPEQLTADGHTLALRGAGVRNKWFLKLYVAGLYLPAELREADAARVIAADAPMAMRLVITSGMITPKKMEHAIREGFDKATDGHTTSLAERIDDFIAVFRPGIHKGDRYDLQYVPGQGTAIRHNGQEKSRIPGLDFKKALFGIWLSERPAQESLKRALLGE